LAFLFKKHYYLSGASLLLGLGIAGFSIPLVLTGGAFLGLHFLGHGLLATNMPLFFNGIFSCAIAAVSLLLGFAIVHALHGLYRLSRFLWNKASGQPSFVHPNKQAPPPPNKPLPLPIALMLALGGFIISPLKSLANPKIAAKTALSVITGLTLATFATIFVLTGGSLIGLNIPFLQGGLLAKEGTTWWIADILITVFVTTVFALGFLSTRSLLDRFMKSDCRRDEYDDDWIEFLDKQENFTDSEHTPPPTLSTSLTSVHQGPLNLAQKNKQDNKKQKTVQFRLPPAAK
jgi:hypothetical protein